MPGRGSASDVTRRLSPSRSGAASSRITASALAAVAEDRDAAVDRVGPSQGGAAADAGLAFALVHQQLELEAARFAGAGPVIAHRGPLRVDGGAQDPYDRAVQPACGGRADVTRRFRRIDPRRKQRLLRIDVS